MKDPGAALTIVTAPRLAGRIPAYDDEVAADDRGWFGYKYEGTDPTEWTNVAVRRAAHIIPDHDDRGLPEIPNGLALCKIHHSAYDANILGISPDLVIHVREDILREIDGPMLEHGLKGMAGRTIIVPRVVTQRPRKEFLDERYRRFVAA